MGDMEGEREVLYRLLSLCIATIGVQSQSLHHLVGISAARPSLGIVDNLIPGLEASNVNKPSRVPF
jgi:hypothetical protein